MWSLSRKHVFLTKSLSYGRIWLSWLPRKHHLTWRICRREDVLKEASLWWRRYRQRILTMFWRNERSILQMVWCRWWWATGLRHRKSEINCNEITTKHKGWMQLMYSWNVKRQSRSLWILPTWFLPRDWLYSSRHFFSIRWTSWLCTLSSRTLWFDRPWHCRIRKYAIFLKHDQVYCSHLRLKHSRMQDALALMEDAS